MPFNLDVLQNSSQLLHVTLQCESSNSEATDQQPDAARHCCCIGDTMTLALTSDPDNELRLVHCHRAASPAEDVTTKERNYEVGKAECLTWGAYPASIDNREQDQTASGIPAPLITQLPTGLYGKTQIFLGLTDRDQEEAFVWEDTNQPPVYTKRRLETMSSEAVGQRRSGTVRIKGNSLLEETHQAGKKPFM
ncbi:hypothetical protein Hamer_G014224 [Homarus americanus]|uniref:Uncharacterized protein n=1 Tax=Homarus americanus TaxID=6706 RepID=A0A8J5JNW7_HOMAM|nr:hypothetical protein Hamer_G014224 [Homarus americanus]